MNRMMNAESGNPTNVAQTPPPDAAPQQSGNAPPQDLPPDAQRLVNGAKAVLFDDRFTTTFEQAVEGATSFASAAATLVMGLIERAQQKLGIELPPEVLYADGGVSDHLMDAVYLYGQQRGVEEAQDAASYGEAMDLVENLGSGVGEPAAPEGVV